MPSLRQSMYAYDLYDLTITHIQGLVTLAACKSGAKHGIQAGESERRRMRAHPG
jgi:hypothetical protein